VAAAEYLMAAGVPPDRILAETQSYDTIGNAFFSRAIHIDPQRMRNLLVITSHFHLPRTQLAFNWIYGLTPVSPYEIHFTGVADLGMDPSVLQERRGKERKSLEALETISRRVTTMRDFHRWLFTEHNAYDSSRRGFGENRVTGETLESY
jgi:uncharacterized SAM-binding protein YcdF (DUF218 family)